MKSFCLKEEISSYVFIAFETAKLNSVFLMLNWSLHLSKRWQVELLAIFRAHAKSFPLITFTVLTDKRELFRTIKCVIATYSVCPKEGIFDLWGEKKDICRELTNDKISLLIIEKKM